jgi:S1-C subfamily serine protease
MNQPKIPPVERRGGGTGEDRRIHRRFSGHAGVAVSYPYEPDPVTSTTTYPPHWMTPEEGPPGWQPSPFDDTGDPPRPPSSRMRGVAVGLVAALLAVAVGAGLGASIGMKHTTQGAAPGATTYTPPPEPGSGAASTTTGVTPGVVDITTTLAYGGGRGAGTGFVLNPSGRVLTANHVIDGASSIKVQVGGSGPRYDAAVVGRDPDADVAVLQLDKAPSLPAAALGDSSKVSPGDPVVAVGNAGGQGTLSSVQGTVVALDQTVTVSDMDGADPKTLRGLIQTTAPLQPGDSGGPLLDAAGKVVGIDTAASTSPFGRFESRGAISFAIPINTAMTVVSRVEKGGTGATTVGPSRGALLGVQVLSVADALAQVGYDAPVRAGAVVVGVGSGTPAEGAGLAAGDVIVSVDGQRLASPDALSSSMLSRKGGDKVKIGWVDPDGATHSADVKLASAP